MSRNIVNAIFEMFEMNRTPRSGWQRAGLRYSMVENNAEHTCLVAQIAFVLAIMEEQDPRDIVCEAVFHDNGEPRIGDQNKLNARYFDKTEGEKRAFNDFVARLPLSVRTQMLTYFNDYKEGASIRAKIVKDADLLQMAFQGKYYVSIGYKFADHFVKVVEKKLQTNSAKDIYRHLLETEFFEWCLV